MIYELYHNCYLNLCLVYQVVVLILISDTYILIHVSILTISTISSFCD